MQSFNSKFTVQVDQASKGEWSDLLLDFDDATIYQTWSYGEVCWGENNLSHIVLRKKGETVAAAQLRIMTIPILKKGIAYLRWGPMWRLRNRRMDFENIRHMVRALKKEYVFRRGLYLKVIPNMFDGVAEANELRSVFESEGLLWRPNSVNYQTFLLDMESTLEELHKNLEKRWRNRLKHAKKNGLKVIEGYNDSLFQTFMGIYKEMIARKQFASFVDINKFRSIQKDLPNHLKMTIIICEHEGEPVSASIFSAIGNTGLCLLSATNLTGRKLQSSYLSKWKTIEWMKERGYRYLDLAGRDNRRNPEVDRFKSGISGKEVSHLGEFEACQSIVSFYIFILCNHIRAISHKTKIYIESRRKAHV
jgi:lipid II:glycine glycyltransferase (peptidoglycan interpeptide bridge formation enzyme)